MRDTARAPQPTTNPPTGHQMSLQGLAQNDQNSFGTFITEKTPKHLVCIVLWSGDRQNVPKMPIFGPKQPKMQILDPISPFGAKILILREEAKVLVPT